MGMGTIYLAGPMRGLENDNFPAFDAAADHLRSYGFHVLSPSEHDRELGFDGTDATRGSFDIHAAFRWDVNAVLGADALVLLSGWEKSTGVGIEKSIADAIGTPVFQYGDAVDGLLLLPIVAPF